MGRVIRAAYLRVYLPEREAGRFDPHVDAGHGGALVMGEFGVWRESLRNDAYVAEWSGHRWVCPRYPRLRMLEGLVAFRNAYPGVAGSALAPERVVRSAAAELERLYRVRPDARSHILTSSWHVPLRWFAAFDPVEREFVTRRDGTHTVRYRTTLGSALERLEDAADVLEEAGFDDAIVEPVHDLHEWLAEFPADAMVELDYGTVAESFSDGELALDETAADIAASLEALREGDFDLAGEHYAAAASRWAAAQALTFSN